LANQNLKPQSFAKMDWRLPAFSYKLPVTCFQYDSTILVMTQLDDNPSPGTGNY